MIRQQFTQDGKEEFLAQTVHISIAPMSSVDVTAFGGPPTRRPSLSLLGGPDRRIQSDNIVPQRPPPLPRAVTAAVAPPATHPLAHSIPGVPLPHQAPPSNSSHDTQVIQVLTTAAQRVAADAQLVHPAASGDLQALQQQQHVLTVTAQAVDNSVATMGSISAQPGNVLAATAQQVVLSAARQISGAGGAQVTVNEVSMATQSAVAQAVELVGPMSNEVDVLRTAKDLLEHHTSRNDPFAGPPIAASGRPSSSRGTGFGALPTVQEFNPALGLGAGPIPLPDLSVGIGFAGHA